MVLNGEASRLLWPTGDLGLSRRLHRIHAPTLLYSLCIVVGLYVVVPALRRMRDFYASAPLPRQPPLKRRFRVAIVGAGVGGSALACWLRELYGEGFTSPYTGKQVKNGRGITKYLKAETGLHYSPHDFRRLFGTVAEYAKVPQSTISQLYNHSTSASITPTDSARLFFYLKAAEPKPRQPKPKGAAGAAHISLQPKPRIRGFTTPLCKVRSPEIGASPRH